VPKQSPCHSQPSKLALTVGLPQVWKPQNELTAVSDSSKSFHVYT
jgi:hypothetical protein